MDRRITFIVGFFCYEMVDFSQPDVLIAGLLVALAIVAFVIVLVLWIRDKVVYDGRQRYLKEAARNQEHSSVLE